MSSLEEIRAARFEQLKAQAQKQEDQQVKLAAQVEQLESFFRAHASREALERFGNLKVAHPRTAIQVLTIFARLLHEGKVELVDDEMLKEVLGKIQQEKRDIKITRR